MRVSDVAKILWPGVAVFPLILPISAQAEDDAKAPIVQADTLTVLGQKSADSAVERLRAALQAVPATINDKDEGQQALTEPALSDGRLSSTMAIPDTILRHPPAKPQALTGKMARATASAKPIVTGSIVRSADMAGMAIGNAIMQRLKSPSHEVAALAPAQRRRFVFTRVKPVGAGFLGLNSVGGVSSTMMGLPRFELTPNGAIPPRMKPEKSRNVFSSRRRAYLPVVRRYARAYGVPLRLADSVVHIESSYNPRARGRAGEIGLMQLMPQTARLIGYRGSLRDLFDPRTNIKYGMKYLAKAYQLAKGSICGTAMRYNGGLARTKSNSNTRRYCRRIKKHLGRAN